MLNVTTKKDNESCCNVTEAGRKVRAYVDNASHEARDAIAATEKQIRSHPVASSAIAASIGFLLGALLRRR